jgi:hypothetical protein
MENEKYVGKGWSNDYGIKVQLKKEDLLNLPTNKYGDIEVFVGQRKAVDEKSKATHWVKWKNKDAQLTNSNINSFVKDFEKIGFQKVETSEDLPF